LEDVLSTGPSGAAPESQEAFRALAAEYAEPKEKSDAD